MKAGGNLGEVVGARLVGFAQGGVDVFLAGDDDPRPALAAHTKLFGDGLQVQHQLGVLADELADLVNKEDDAMAWALGVQVVTHQFSKAFDVDAVTVTGIVEPLASGLGRHLQSSTQTGDDVVAQEVHGIAFVGPIVAVGGLKGVFEYLKTTLGNEVTLHVRHVWCVARQTLHLVEDAQEHLQDGVAIGLSIGFGIDVEEDDVGLAGHGAANVAQKHRVFDLRFEELRCMPPLTAGRVGGFQVGQQVRQNLDEVRFARTEESRHPDPHPS